MIVVMICGSIEWDVIRDIYRDIQPERSPFGESFEIQMDVSDGKRRIRFFYSGGGKVDAAAGTQYAIDEFAPEVLLNLGTCGGFEGDVQVDDLLLVERTVIYDIHERMRDGMDAVRDFITDIDLSWIPPDYPTNVRLCTMATADADIAPDSIGELRSLFSAVAGDWESGSVARICSKNGVRCLILRAVSDIVSLTDGEAYGNVSLYVSRTESIMKRLVESLPEWIEVCRPAD